MGADKKSAVSDLMEQGKLKGKLTTKEITDALEELDFDVEQMDKLYDSLESLNIEIIEDYNPEQDLDLNLNLDEVLEEVDLAGTGKKTFKNFSLGMKQRLGLALALMNRPDLLLLDEPINGLDPEGIVEFRNLLLRLNQERQTTILISSHILSELANLATCYGFLDNGMMLEQISARALEEKCRACIEARVDDASRAALVLEQSLGIRDYEVLPGHLLRIYSSLDAPHRVAQALVEGGVALQSIESRGANLEDYFLSMIGGVRHA